jgi:hemerythrin superfamily protein
MTSKLEEFASKTLGAVKAAKAAFEGLDGVFRHLEREHGEVTALLLRLQISSDPKVRRELWPTIRNELLAHEQAEKAEVYPAFLQDSDTREMAQEHTQDASELEEAIAELNAIEADSERWQPTLQRLIQMVQEHVRDEEEEYFPIADRLFKDRSDDMLERFEKAKAKALGQLTSTK